MTTITDTRMRRPDWSAAGPAGARRRWIRFLLVATVPLALFYFAWLLQPQHIGQPVLYALLLAAEMFNAAQALGFWWTCARERPWRRTLWDAPPPAVDVFVPVYDEPVSVVEPTVRAAARMSGADVRVHVLDDGDSDEMAAMAARLDAGYLRRDDHDGAKAGNINHALAHTDAPFVVVLDCDHVPEREFLEATLGCFTDRRVAFAQAPQYYANWDRGEIPAAAWGQQALFFGPIARGKDGHDAMFCCGTNVVFRRHALRDVGGFPTESVTEDFELSIHLHERGWKSRYVPEVLAHGLGPEDMASYVSQQQRWSRGCLAAIPAVLRSTLPLRQKVQYLLSASYFLSGWTVLIYMSFPVIRLIGGGQPIAGITAPEFLLHFAPYFAVALTTVALAGAGSYTFAAFALAAANFWIHILSTIYTVLRKEGSFVVTPKVGAGARQPAAVMPALVVVGILVLASIYGLVRERDAATINNVCFAAVHVSILLTGCWPALAKPRIENPESPELVGVTA